MDVMKGKSLLVVSLRNGNGGYMGDNIKDKLVEGGYSGVALKVAHGNHWNYAHSEEDCIRFRDSIAGLINFYGWHWNEGFDPAGEAIIACKAIDELGLTAYMMDYEAPMKTRPGSQVPLLQEFRQRKSDFPLGLCSYRYPSSHPAILWNDILPFFDFHAPQVYWMQAHDPAVQLQKSYDELITLKNIPVFPVGPAFAESGWQPTKDEIREFDQKAKSLGMKGIQFFSYRGARDLGYFPVLASLEWAVEAPPTPEPPVNCSEQDARIVELEAEIAVLNILVDGNYTVAYNEGWNAGLQALIQPIIK